MTTCLPKYPNSFLKKGIVAIIMYVKRGSEKEDGIDGNNDDKENFPLRLTKTHIERHLNIYTLLFTLIMNG